MAVKKIRVSVGSAAVLELNSLKMETPPTLCYLMQYKEGKCSANCGFCPQARSSTSSIEKLSRINWPVFPFKDVLTKLKYMLPSKRFGRICVQTLNYPENYQDLLEIVQEIKKSCNIPISAAIPPLEKQKLRMLKNFGLERVGIALDGSTPKIFERIKGKEANGPYTWETHWNSLKDAIEVFTKGFVSTHIIIGLGETQQEAMSLISGLHKLSILPGLFAFTPIEGTALEDLPQPELLHFRKIQLGRHLLIKDFKRFEDFPFNSKGVILNFNINKTELMNIIDNDEAFMTTGCPNCNRPYYTSKPSGPIYNYPRRLKNAEKDEIFNLLQRFVI